MAARFRNRSRLWVFRMQTRSLQIVKEKNMRVFSPRKSLKLLSLITAMLFCAVANSAQSQAAGADLTGSVSDPSGAAIAGATVQASGIDTGISRNVTTSSGGNSQIIGLPPGEIEVT